MVKSSDTGGVKPMSIVGRLGRERERLLGMTDAERAWRKQWLKDQILSPNEPRRVPELYKELYNPIRRAYRAPLDMMGKALVPVVGQPWATYIRYWSGKFFLATYGTLIAAYYFRYNRNDWTRKGGWRLIEARPATLPGDPGYPKVSDKVKGSDYDSRRFNKVTLNL